MIKSLKQQKNHILLALGCLTLSACMFLLYMISNEGSARSLIPHPAEIQGATTSIYLEKNGTQLRLFGQPYTFTGVNAYSAATLYGSNAGCGGQISDLDALFSSLRPNSVVRFWGWQGSMVTNVTTKQPDWKGIDRVLAAAARHNQRVIISLGDQSGTCDDGLWKDQAWYNGGFMNVSNTNGMTPLSYYDFVQLVVNRYKDNPTIAMWELINEPEASTCQPGYTGSGCYGHQTCTDTQAAANSLRYFYDTVGGKIKQIDPNHLIESGVIGTGQCGADNSNYQFIHESPSIDVASYHDYGSPDNPMPGDQWNGLQVRLNQMKNIQKPLIVGEVGMLAQDNTTGCMSFTSRKDKITAKINAQFTSGVVGYIPWAWASNNAGVCNYDIPPTDPLMTLLHDTPLLEVTPPPPTPTPTGTITPTPTAFIITPTVPTNTPTVAPSVIPSSTITPIPPTITNTPSPTPAAGDTSSPIVSILYPTTQTGVPRNSTVNIQANAYDNVKVASVDFSVNNKKLCTVLVEPYTCSWKVTGQKGAEYTITVRAVDTRGNASQVSTKVVAK